MIPNFDKCLKSIDQPHFFIQDGDDQEPAYITEEDGEFQIINNTNCPINFLPIDSCVYGSSDISRCDCSVYNEKTFCFIELKCIKPKNFNKKRKEAEDQLEITIKEFKNEEIVHGKTLEAYVSLNCQIKINDNFEPITQQPTNKTKAAHFLLTFSTKLYYNTKKEFN